MWKSAYVGVCQLLNWKMHGETLKFIIDSIWQEVAEENVWTSGSWSYRTSDKIALEIASECLLSSLIRVINLNLVTYAVQVSCMGGAATLLIFQSENMKKSNQLVDRAIDKILIWKFIFNWCEEIY